MAVTYVVKEKANPLKRDDFKKWYATAKSSGELTFRQLSKEIAAGSTTVSDTDVLAVLNDLTKILRRNLEAGKIVRFGDFGSFQITLSSAGAPSEDKFHPSLIRGSKVQFRPGIDLREMQNNLKFKKV